MATYFPKAKNGIFSIKELNSMGHAAAKRYAVKQGIPRIPHPTTSELINRPKCTTKKCKNLCIPLNWHWTSGEPVYRSVCDPCHQKNTAEKHGLTNIIQVVAKNAGFDSVAEYLDDQARQKGFKNHTAYMNSKHPYLKYRKDYCENIDKRLKFKCTTTIFWEGMLDVDHVNGKPNDNREENLQTLCKCCHAYKTNLFKDYASEGRDAIKKKQK